MFHHVPRKAESQISFRGVQIVEVNDKVVVLDANHPLAGEDLTFDIEVIDVK